MAFPIGARVFCRLQLCQNCGPSLLAGKAGEIPFQRRGEIIAPAILPVMGLMNFGHGLWPMATQRAGRKGQPCQPGNSHPHGTRPPPFTQQSVRADCGGMEDAFSLAGLWPGSCAEP